jgi:hypothetical protein
MNKERLQRLAGLLKESKINEGQAPALSSDPSQMYFIEQLYNLFNTNHDDLEDIANWYAAFTKMAEQMKQEAAKYNIDPEKMDHAFKDAMVDWKEKNALEQQQEKHL